MNGNFSLLILQNITMYFFRCKSTLDMAAGKGDGGIHLVRRFNVVIYRFERAESH